MLRRFIALAGLSLISLAAHATLTTLPAPWPPAGSSGLENVLFNVNSASGMTVAVGAHGYKNSALLPNDGISVFYAQPGVYPGEPSKNYANWSFDFAYNLGTCTTCSVFLRIDTDPSTPATFAEAQLNNVFGSAYLDSWNLEMPFLGINFDPQVASSTAFQLVIRDGSQDVLSTNITVEVPEPGTLALAGLALAGLGVVRRRNKS